MSWMNQQSGNSRPKESVKENSTVGGSRYQPVVDLEYLKKENTKLAQKNNYYESTNNQLKKAEEALKKELNEAKSKVHKLEESDRKNEERITNFVKTNNSLKQQLETLNLEKLNLTRGTQNINRRNVAGGMATSSIQNTLLPLPINSRKNEGINQGNNGSNIAELESKLKEALSQVAMLTQENARIKSSPASLIPNPLSSASSPITQPQHQKFDRSKPDDLNELRRKLSNLETQCCRFENEKICMQKKVDKEKEEHENRKRDAAREISELKRALDDLHKKSKSDIESISRDFINEKNLLVGKIEHSQAESKKSKDSLKSIQHKFETLEMAHNNLLILKEKAEEEAKQSLSQLGEQKHLHESQQRALSEEHKQLLEKHDKLEHLYQTTLVQVSKLEKTQSIDPAAFDEMEKSRLCLENQILELKESLSLEKDKVQASHQVLEEKNLLICELNESKLVLVKKIEDNDFARVASQEENARIQNELDNIKGLLLESETSKFENEGKIDMLTQECEKLEFDHKKEKDVLVDLNTSLTNEVSSLKDIQEQLNSRIAVSDNKIITLEQTCTENASEISKLNSQIHVSTQRIDQLSLQNLQSQQTQSKILDEKDRVLKQLDINEADYKERIGILQGALKRKEDAIDELNGKLSVVMADRAGLAKKIDKVHSEYEDDSEQIADLKLQINQFKQAQTKDQQLIESLQNDLTLLTGSNEASKKQIEKLTLELRGFESEKRELIDQFEKESSKLSAKEKLLRDSLADQDNIIRAYKETTATLSNVENEFNRTKRQNDDTINSLNIKIINDGKLIAEKDNKIFDAGTEISELKSKLDQIAKVADDEKHKLQQTIESLKKQIEEIGGSSNEQTKKLSLLQLENDNLNDSLNQHYREMEKVTSELSESRVSFNSLTLECHSLKENLSITNESLLKVYQEKSRLENELEKTSELKIVLEKELEAHLSSQTAQQASMTATINDLKATIKSLASDLESAKGKSSAVKMELDKVKMELSIRDDDFDDLESKYTAVVNKSPEGYDQIEVLKTQVVNLEQALLEKENRFNHLNNEYEKLVSTSTSEIETLNKEELSTTEAIKQYTLEIERYKIAISTHGEKIALLENEIHASQKVTENLRTEIDSLSLTLRDKNSCIEDNNLALEKLKEEKEIISSELSRLSTLKQSSDAEVSELKTKLQEASSLLSESTRKGLEMSDSLETLHQKHALIVKELELSAADKSALESEIDVRNNEKMLLISQLKEEICSLTLKVGRLENSCIEKQEELLKAQDSRNNLEVEISQVESDKAKLEMLLTSKDKVISSLEEKASNLTSFSDDRTGEMESLKETICKLEKDQELYLQDKESLEESFKSSLNDLQNQIQHSQHIILQKSQELESSTAALEANLSKIEELSSKNSQDALFISELKESIQVLESSKENLEECLAIEKERFQAILSEMELLKSDGQNVAESLEAELKNARSELESNISEKLLIANELQDNIKLLSELQSSAQAQAGKSATVAELLTEKTSQYTELKVQYSELEIVKNELQIQQVELKDTVVALRYEVEFSKAELDKLQKLHTDLAAESSSQLQESHQINDDLEKEISSLKEELHVLTVTKNDLVDINSEREELSNSLNSRVSQLEALRSQLEQQIDVLTLKQSNISSKYDDVTSELKDINNLYSAELNAKEQLKCDLDNSDSENKKLAEKIVSFENRISSLQNELESQCKVIACNTVDMSSLENDIEKLEANVAVKDSEISKLAGLLESTKQTLETKIALIHAQEIKMQDLLLEASKTGREVEEYQLQAKRLAEENEKFSNQKEFYIQELDSLKLEHANLINEHELIKKSLDEANHTTHLSINEKSQNIVALEERLSSLSSKNMLLISESENRASEIIVLENKIKELNNDLMEQTQKFNTSTKLNLEVQDKMAELISIVSSTTQERDSALSELALTKVERENLSSQVSSLSSSIEENSALITELQNLRDSLVSDKEILIKDIYNLKLQNESLSLEITSCSSIVEQKKEESIKIQTLYNESLNEISLLKDNLDSMAMQHNGELDIVQQKLQELINEKTVLVQEILQLKNDSKAQAAVLSSVTMEKNILLDDISDMEESYSKISQELETLKNEYNKNISSTEDHASQADRDLKIEHLETQLSALGKNKSAAEESLVLLKSEFATKISEFEYIISEKESNIEKLRGDADILENKLKQAEQIIQTKTNQYRIAETDLNDRNYSIKELNSSIDLINQEKSKLKATVDEYFSTIKSLEKSSSLAELKKLEQVVESKNIELDIFKKAVSSSDIIEVQTLISMLEEQSSMIVKMKEDLDGMKSSYINANTTSNSQVCVDPAELQIQLSQAQSLILYYEKQVSQEQARYNSERIKSDNIRFEDSEKIKEMKENLLQAEEHLRTVDGEKFSLQNQLDKLSIQNENMSALLLNKDSEIETAKAKVESLEVLKSQLESNVDTLKVSISQLEYELSQQRDEQELPSPSYEELSNQLEESKLALTKALDDINAASVSTSQQIIFLENEKKAVALELETLKGELHASNLALLETQTKLEKTSENYENGKSDLEKVHLELEFADNQAKSISLDLENTKKLLQESSKLDQEKKERIAVLENVVAEYEQTKKKLDEENSLSLKNLTDEHLREIDTLKAEIESSKLNSEDIKSQIILLTKELEEKDVILGTTNDTLQNLESFKLEMEAHVSQLNSKLEQEVDSKRILETALQLLEREKDEAGTIISSLNFEIRDKNELIKSLEKVVDEKSNYMDGEIGRLTKLSNDDKDKIETLEKKVAEASESLVKAISDATDLSKDLSASKEKIDLLEKENNGIKDENKAILAEKDKLADQLASTTRELENVSGKTDSLNSEILNLKKKNDDDIEQLVSLKAQLKYSCEEYEKLKIKFQKVDLDLTSSKNELEDQLLRLSDSEKEISDKNSKIVSLEESISEAGSKLDLKIQKLSQLEAYVEELKFEQDEEKQRLKAQIIKYEKVFKAESTEEITTTKKEVEPSKINILKRSSLNQVSPENNKRQHSSRNEEESIDTATSIETANPIDTSTASGSDLVKNYDFQQSLPSTQRTTRRKKNQAQLRSRGAGGGNKEKEGEAECKQQ